MFVFSLRDMKSKVSLRPFVEQSKVAAIRGMTMMMQDAKGDTIVQRFPNDFRLQCIGEFNEESGILVAYERPDDLGSAADFVSNPKQETLKEVK